MRELAVYGWAVEVEDVARNGDGWRWRDDVMDC